MRGRGIHAMSKGRYGPLRWLQRRRDARRADNEADRLRKTYSGSVFMTQAQALTAATWVVQGGDEPPDPDVALRNLFLANMIALGFGPRTFDRDARSIWHLFAVHLGVSPVADYPTVSEYSMRATDFMAHGVVTPGYEFWAMLPAQDSHVEFFAAELRNLSVAHRDDMPTMFLHQLATHFGAADPDQLTKSFQLLLLHAGFTMKTVAEDVADASEEGRGERIELASLYEGRMLAVAKYMRDQSERNGFTGAYGVQED